MIDKVCNVYDTIDITFLEYMLGILKYTFYALEFISF